MPIFIIFYFFIPRYLCIYKCVFIFLYIYFGCWLAVSLKWKIAQFSIYVYLDTYTLYIYVVRVYIHTCMCRWCIVSGISLCRYLPTFNIIIFNFITVNTNIGNNIIITFTYLLLAYQQHQEPSAWSALTNSTLRPSYFVYTSAGSVARHVVAVIFYVTASWFLTSSNAACCCFFAHMYP